MNSISFHIYKTPNSKTWTLAYTVSGHKIRQIFDTQIEAMQASYTIAAFDITVD